jgi:membrane protein
VNDPWGFLREVVARFVRLRGSNLAAAIAFRAYLALFAVLVLAVAVAGFLDASGRDVARWIIDALGVHGEAARTVIDAVDRAQASRAATTVVGLLGLVWTGTSLAAAIAYAWNVAWGIPGGGMGGRVRGLGWLAGGGFCIGAAIASTGLVAGSALGGVLAVVIGIVADLALVLLTAWLLPARRIPLHGVLPAAAVTAVGLTAVRIAGAEVLGRLVLNSSAVYGTIGVLFALLLWMLVVGEVLVVAAFVEAAVWMRTHGTAEVTVTVPRLEPDEVRARAARAASRRGRPRRG